MRMKSGYHLRLGIVGIIGAIFAPIGLLFTVVGLIAGRVTEDMRSNQAESARILRYIFCGIGLLFFIIGAAMLAVILVKHFRIRKLIDAGQYVMADFIGAEQVNNVDINGRNPYRALFRFVTAGGEQVIFRSRMLTEDPTPLLTGRQIPVYADPTDFDRYYADIDTVTGIR